MPEQSLVSISEASHILGVSEAALRQWTDEGKIKAFITPGGHRRYSMAELKKLMTSPQKVIGIKDLISELEDTVKQHREIGRTHFSHTSWYNKLNEEAQGHLADSGRHLLKLIIRYITEPSKREETIKLAHDAGYDLGETLARLGLHLTDSVEAFVLHRNLIMDAAAHLIKKKEALTGRVVEAIPRVDRVMDEVLVSLVAAHQQYQDRLQSALKGGPPE